MPADDLTTPGMPTEYPGQTLSLPAEGAGSLAPWRARVAALLVDWALCMGLAVLFFGQGVLREHSWRAQAPMALFFVESSVFTALAGGSIGQLLARIGVTRVDASPIAWWQAIVRSALKCLVIPVLVVGAERRHLTDMVLGTVVVNRR